jgi:hypothetical protein
MGTLYALHCVEEYMEIIDFETFVFIVVLLYDHVF